MFTTQAQLSTQSVSQNTEASPAISVYYVQEARHGLCQYKMCTVNESHDFHFQSRIFPFYYIKDIPCWAYLILIINR